MPILICAAAIAGALLSLLSGLALGLGPFLALATTPFSGSLAALVAAILATRQRGSTPPHAKPVRGANSEPEVTPAAAVA